MNIKVGVGVGGGWGELCENITASCSVIIFIIASQIISIMLPALMEHRAKFK